MNRRPPDGSMAAPRGGGGPLVLTRRCFLRVGAGGLGLLVCAPLLPACGSEPLSPEPEPDPGPLEACGVILADPRLCAGCGRCALVCSALHGDGSGADHAFVGPDRSYQELQFSSAAFAATTCHMCPELLDPAGERIPPPCVASCPYGAARIAELAHPVYGSSRVRYIDVELCRGCGQCVEHCPYDHPLLRGGKAGKCDLCRSLDDRPACVDACPAMALRYLTPWAAALPSGFPWDVSELDGAGGLGGEAPEVDGG